MTHEPGSLVMIDYTNWRGDRADRLIRPAEIYLGRTKQHPNKQWLLRAFDLIKGEYRDFAMKDIHSWNPAPDHP